MHTTCKWVIENLSSNSKTFYPFGIGLSEDMVCSQEDYWSVKLSWQVRSKRMAEYTAKRNEFEIWNYLAGCSKRRGAWENCSKEIYWSQEIWSNKIR